MEINYRRDERVIRFLTFRMDKYAAEYAAKRRNVKSTKKGGLIMAQQQSEIRYLTPPSVDVKNEKSIAVSKKGGIKYIDYKDPEFLKKFLNEQGKIPSSPYYRYFFEVPTSYRAGC